MPVTDLWEGDREAQHSPYGSFWYRAVACVLLPGRVQAKHDGTPNMTDVNRVGKEANFNQYLTERVGTLLVASDVVRFDRQGGYEAGPNLAAFWDHDDARLPAITRQAVTRLVGHQTGHPFWHPKAPEDWGLIELLSIFSACFRGLALVESEVGQVFSDFTRLPQDDLVRAARGLGLEVDSVDVVGWQMKLDTRGRKALVAALYTSEWAYYAEQRADRLVVRQPDRPGDARARAATPHAGPGDGVQGAARPVGVRGGGAGPGGTGAPVPTRHDQANRPGLRVPARPQAAGRDALGRLPGRGTS